ncbi:hypothetical protein [Blastomonas sp.]|uniref:hypothetical protein n=1 Tax=Blastomonas sp. TaxID=1909299 RepID=UPI003593A997
MNSFSILTTLSITAALIAGAPAADAFDGKRRGEQSQAREQFMAGRVMSLREIENRVLPRMQGLLYLGPEYDARALTYRLKFRDGSRVIFVDVDARTGSILRQSG